MPYLRLPNGSYVEVDEGVSAQEALSRARAKFPEAFEPVKPKDTGFTGAFKASKEELKGDIGALAGKLGLMDEDAAQKYVEEKKRAAKAAFAPTEEGWSEAPVTKFKELLGGSLPYMAAPLAAGAAAAVAPVAAPVAAGLGLGATALVSGAQFTGSNLQRQMEEGKTLKETDLGSAALAAVPQAALDTLSMKMIPGIGRIFGQAGVKITPQMAKQIAEQGTLQTFKAYGAKAAKTGGIEGLTESGQQFLERLQAGLNIADEDARREYFESFVGGAVLGGTLAVPGTYFERGKAKGVAEEESRRVQQEEAAALQAQKAIEADEKEQLALAKAQQKTGDLFGEEVKAQELPSVKAAREAEEAAGAEKFDRNEMLRQRDVMMRELSDIEKQRDAAAEKGDTTTFAALVKRSNQMEGALAALDKDIKATPIEVTPDIEMAQLRGQLKKLTTQLSRQVGPAYDAKVAAGLADKIEQVEKRINELAPAASQFELFDPAEMQAAQNRAERGEREARAQEQADLFAAQKEPSLTSADTYLQGLQELEDAYAEGASERIIDQLVAKLQQIGQEKEAGKVGIVGGAEQEGSIARINRIKRAIAEEQAKLADATTNEEVATIRADIAALNNRLGIALTESATAQPENARSKAISDEGEAMGDLRDAVEDLKSGRYFNGRDTSTAASFRSGLEKQANEAADAYINAAIRDINAQRALNNQQSLSTDEALKLTTDLRRHLNQVIQFKNMEGLMRPEYKQQRLQLMGAMSGEEAMQMRRMSGEFMAAKREGKLTDIYSSVEKQLAQIKNKYAKGAPKRQAGPFQLRQEFAPKTLPKEEVTRDEEYEKRYGKPSEGGVSPDQKDLFAPKDLEPVAITRATPQNFMRFVMTQSRKAAAAIKQADAVIAKMKTPTEALTEKVDSLRNTSKEYGAKLAELKADATEEAQAMASTAYAKKFYTEGLALAKQLYTGNIAEARNALGVAQFELNNLQQRLKSVRSPRLRGLLKEELKDKESAYASAKIRLENLFGSFEATIDNYREVETKKLEDKYLNSLEFNRIKKLIAENAKKNKYAVGKLGFVKEAEAEVKRAEVGKVEAAEQKTLEEQVKAKREAEQAALQTKESLPKTRQEIVPTNRAVPGADEKVLAKRLTKKAEIKTQAQKAAELAAKERELAEERKAFREQTRQGLTPQQLEKEIKNFKALAEESRKKGNAAAAKRQEATAKRLEKELKSKMDVARMAMRGEGKNAKPTPPKMKTGVKSETSGRKAKKDFEEDALDHGVKYDDYMEIQRGLAFGFKARDEAAKTGEGITKKDADAVVSKLKLPKGLKLVVVNKLQGNLRAAVEAQGMNPDTVRGGVMANGSVFIVAENHTDIKDLQKTLAHEITGHLGVEQTLGEAGMKALIKKIGDKQAVMDLADKLGVGEDAAAAYAAAKRIGKTEEQALGSAVRELIAHTEEARIDKGFLAKAGEFIKAMVGAVRAALRKMGIDLDISTNDIFKILRDARKDFNAVTPGAYVNKDGEIMFRDQKPVANAGFEGVLGHTNKFIAKQKPWLDRIRGEATGLIFQTKYIDRFAPVMKVLESVKDSLKATQLMYFLRMHDQRMSWTAETTSTGAPKIVEKTRANGDVERIIETQPGANLKDMAVALREANVGNPAATNRVFTLYMAALRAKRVGLAKLNFGPDVTQKMLDDTINAVNADAKTKAAFEKAAEIYNEYNINLVNFAVQTGAIPKDVAKLMLASKDYVPFYRARSDGTVVLEIGGAPAFKIGNLKDQPYLHELVGGDEAILDIFTSAVQNTSMMIDMSLRNLATRNVAWTLAEMGLLKKGENEKGNGIHKVKGDSQGPTGPDIIRFKLDGVNAWAVVDTDAAGVPAELLVKGLEGVNTALPNIVKMFNIPANILRKWVTRNPAYALRQVIRDPLNAVMVSGANTTPVVSSLKEIAKMIRGKSEGEPLLQRRGILGGQVLTGTSEDVKQILLQITSGKKGWDYYMAKADQLAIQGDASTRVVMYNSFIKQGLSEMEATLATLEAMNFSKRGTSPSLFALSTMVPFMNAQIQGLNVLYQAYKGNMPFNEKLKVKQKLVQRGLMMTGFTLLYAALMQDDEAYKNANDDEKYGNWFVYTPFFDEPVRVPIPFELGFVFKAVPEALSNTIFGDEKARDTMSALAKMAWNSVPISGPQGVKPALEVALNHSFYTGRDIESERLQRFEPGERYNDRTTELVKSIGKATNISPVKLEYLIRGYTGSVPLAVVSLANPVVRSGETGAPPEGRSSELPLIGSFFQPKDASGLVSKAYKDVEEIGKVKETWKKMEEEGRYKEADAYLNANADALGLASLAGSFRQRMGEITKIERQIKADPSMSGEEKKLALEQLRQDKIDLAKALSSARD